MCYSNLLIFGVDNLIILGVDNPIILDVDNDVSVLIRRKGGANGRNNARQLNT